MFLGKFFHPLLLGGTLLSLLFAADLSAQRSPTGADDDGFTGPYRVGDYAGKATFGYRGPLSDTLIQGPFAFRGGNVRSLLDGEDTYFAFEGNYDNGRPTGNWSFSFGDLAATGPGELVDYEYRLRLNGTQHIAEGTITDGRPDGLWTQTISRIEDSEVTGEALQAEMNFLAGVPVQTLSVASGTASLLGRFKRTGEAHDAWVVYDDLLPAETWYFDNGTLQRVEVISAGDTITVPVFAGTNGASKTVNLDGTYLDLLSDWQRLQDRPDPFGDSPAPELLRVNAEHLARVSRVATDLGAEAFSPVFAVTVPHFPLSPPQRKQLATIAADLARIDTVARQMTGANSLTVLRGQDEEIAFSLAALEELKGDFVAPVRELVEAYRDGRLEYLPLKKYVNSLFPEPIDGAVPIGFTLGQEKTRRDFAGPDARIFDVPKGGLDEVTALADYVLASVEDVRSTLNAKLNTKERRQLVMALEDQLVVEFARLDSLITSYGKRTVRDYNLGAIRESARQQIDAYAATDDVLEKRTRGETLISCMESMEALVLNLTDQPRRRDELRELYTDEVWNHNLAVLMTEKVKRRVFDAYDEVLLPSFAGRVTDRLTCPEAAALNTDITFVNTRLRALRKADTEDLEDELKGVRDASTVLSLLRPDTPQ